MLNQIINMKIIVKKVMLYQCLASLSCLCGTILTFMTVTYLKISTYLSSKLSHNSCTHTFLAQFKTGLLCQGSIGLRSLLQHLAAFQMSFSQQPSPKYSLSNQLSSLLLMQNSYPKISLNTASKAALFHALMFHLPTCEVISIP